MIDLRPGRFHLVSLKDGSMWNVRRRPLPPCALPYVSHIIASWQFVCFF